MPRKANDGIDKRGQANKQAGMTKRRLDRSRRLHSGRFVFMRSLVQGVDERTAWDGYVRIEGEHLAPRKVKSTIA